MKVYVIRHADAVPLDAAGVNSDADRPLSEKGEKQCKDLAATLHRRGVTLNVLLTSPLLRARQTAQGLVEAWKGTAPEIRLCDHLAPGGKSSRIARELRKLTEDGVGIVGHMDDLAEHAAWLLGSKKARLDFDKAGVAAIDCTAPPDKGAGVLRWLITPDWFCKE